MISLTQPSRLYRLARRLHLSAPSIAKLFVAYYGGRRAALHQLFPDSVILESSVWGKIPIRTNGYDHGLLDQIFVREDYRSNFHGVQRILDLGANIGMATLYLSHCFPHAEIACVEPSPHNLPLLKRTVALNGIRARVFEGAAGAQAGMLELNISSNPDHTSAFPVDNAIARVSVPVVSVPEIMRSMSWDHIDLLKIDIEGGEKEVLGSNNEWLKQVQIIMGESHVGVDYPYSRLQDDLKPFNFVFDTLIAETTEWGATFRAQRKAG